MIARILPLIFAVGLPIALTAGELTGTASYRERIALPAEAQFQAILFDISNNGQIEIGRFDAAGDAGPPYTFVIPYADDAVTEDGLYAIQTKIIWPDKPYVAAGTLLEGFPATTPKIDLVMMRPAATTAAAGTIAPMTSDAQIAPVLGAHELPLPATYQGDVKTNGQSQTWHLNLAADQSFQLLRDFGDKKTFSSIGRWHADPTHGTLILRDGAEMPLSVARAGQTGLHVIDANIGETYDGTLALADKMSTVALSDMFLGGMMTYMADAAVFVECLSGSTFPIAQEGDYLALERMYLADQSGLGEPLYVMLEGGIAEGPAMEGPDRQMVIVDTFIRTQQNTTCERQMADASLRNTYWRLDQLDGAPVTGQEGRIEPHLVLEAGDSLNYRTTLGCNRMRGTFIEDDTAVSFGPTAATMMACPAPLDALESQFGKVLSEIETFAIVGESLVLRDGSDIARALFTAVYF